MNAFKFAPFDSEYGIVYKVLCFSIVLCAVLMLGTIICADKTPQSYYLETNGNNPAIATCVMANEKWQGDPTVYCGDISSAYMVLQGLQGTVKAKKPTAQHEVQAPQECSF